MVANGGPADCTSQRARARVGSRDGPWRAALSAHRPRTASQRPPISVRVSRTHVRYCAPVAGRGGGSRCAPALHPPAPTRHRSSPHRAPGAGTQFNSVQPAVNKNGRPPLPTALRPPARALLPCIRPNQRGAVTAARSWPGQVSDRMGALSSDSKPHTCCCCSSSSSPEAGVVDRHLHAALALAACSSAMRSSPVAPRPQPGPSQAEAALPSTATRDRRRG